MITPEAPQDVRLVYKDGTEQAVEVAYLGYFEGQYIWEVTVRPRDLTTIRRIKIGMLPAYTTVNVEVAR